MANINKNIAPLDIAVRKAWLKIFKMYNQRAMQYGVSFSLGLVLLSIDKEGTPSTQLGPKMGMEPTSLSRTLKMMEEEQLIKRVPDTVDKRVVYVFLTPKGVAHRRIARDEVLEYNKMLYSEIDNQDIETMLRVLDQVCTLTEY
jgi:MarR family transcriptional regulator, organic hydroperoxide resistance regulator